MNPLPRSEAEWERAWERASLASGECQSREVRTSTGDEVAPKQGPEYLFGGRACFARFALSQALSHSLPLAGEGSPE
jgi:hypothetical protein